jgi:sulfite reductase alpha subunit-like flavoprotein
MAPCSAMLFFGCRHPDRDSLYRNELEDFMAGGLVAAACSLSRHEGSPFHVCKTDWPQQGIKYVPD